MLTFEQVLSGFKDYLSEDARYEVLMTSHGYTILGWDSITQNWSTAEFCPTPEDMRDILLDAFAEYLEYRVTQSKRQLTDEEWKMIQAKLDEISNSIRESTPSGL